MMSSLTDVDVSISDKRRAALQSELERWLPLLIEHLQPERIILFGSLIQDDVREWSDVDLAIIQETSLPFLKRTQTALLLLRPRVGVDLLVYTPEEFARLASERRFVREEIVGKGKVLYERG
jgi:predicted nucleotidyltransferase